MLVEAEEEATDAAARWEASIGCCVRVWRSTSEPVGMVAYVFIGTCGVEVRVYGREVRCLKAMGGEESTVVRHRSDDRLEMGCSMLRWRVCWGRCRTLPNSSSTLFSYILFYLGQTDWQSDLYRVAGIQNLGGR